MLTIQLLVYLFKLGKLYRSNKVVKLIYRFLVLPLYILQHWQKTAVMVDVMVDLELT